MDGVSCSSLCVGEATRRRSRFPGFVRLQLGPWLLDRPMVVVSHVSVTVSEWSGRSEALSTLVQRVSGRRWIQHLGRPSSGQKVLAFVP